MVFKKGKKRPAKAGREKGTPNQITRIVKEAVIEAAVNVGKNGKGKGELVGYLEWVARAHPQAFMALLGKLIPLQVRMDQAKDTVYRTVSEVRVALEERGITLDLVAQEVEALDLPDMSLAEEDNAPALRKVGLAAIAPADDSGKQRQKQIDRKMLG